ncbi:beta-defensin 4-like [Acomys russatus]|uniref:beta-defensin 4-like n=1 Tax=Acomys russatus TaxID=60746 RepID=UPI0021E25D84|nr:beta-defensin 4-like [Acomys russatus]
MKLYCLLLTFLLVLLSPFPAFIQAINNPFTCLIKGGICWGPCSKDFRQIGTCGIPKSRCCKRK